MGDGEGLAWGGGADMVVLCGGKGVEVLDVEADTLLACVCEVCSLAEFEEEVLRVEDVHLSYAREVGNPAESAEEVMMDVNICFLALRSSPVV